MERYFKRLLNVLWITLFIALLVSNIRYWAEDILPVLRNGGTHSGWWITLNPLGFMENQTYVVVFGFGVGLAYLSMFLNYIQDNGKGSDKANFNPKDYSKILSKFKRRRGTVMVKYASKDKGKIKRGDPIETGIIKWWYRIKTPIARQYNKLGKHFLWPQTRMWNEVKYDEEGKEIVAGGVPVMAMRRCGLVGKFDKVWYLSGDQHSLFVGSTGRGKTFTYVLPMIYSYIRAGESIVVHDPKREIDAYTRTALEGAGYNVIVIDFVDPKHSDGWNPFDVPYQEWKKAIDEDLDTWKIENVVNRRTGEVEKFYVKNIAAEDKVVGDKIVKGKDVEVRIAEKDKYTEGYKYANVSSGVELTMAVAQALAWEEDAKDPFWHQGAGDMIAGGALFAMEEARDDLVNAKTVRYLIELGDDADKKGVPLLRKYLNKYREVDSESTRKYATYLNAEGNTKTSLKSVFMNKVAILTANDDIMNMTSKTTFDMHKVFEEKTAIFLKTHDERSTYYPLVSLFLKQLYEVGIKVTRERPEEQRLDIPMNWVIDEMGLLPEIKDIEAIYGAARSRGVRINAFIQTFEQLEDKYEDKVAKIIEDNSTNVIYLGSQSVTTRKRFSELAGEKLVYNRRRKDYEVKPVITPEKLKSFEKGRSLINTIEWDPFISKLPPYDKYSFFEKPVWGVKHNELPKAQYFNIRNEWKMKQLDESKGRDQRTTDSGSTPVDVISGSGSKERARYISKSK